MKDYEIVDTHVDNIDVCCLCGNKAANNLGRCRKADWLKMRYAEGLRYKVLRSPEFGDVGMIEYVPGTHSWRPVEAAGYLVIHCLMILNKHTGKGLGTLLLNSCLEDAKMRKCYGVAVVTSADAFMAKRDVFLKAGFVLVDSAPPYEVLVKKLHRIAPDPYFIVDRERLSKKYKSGLTILAADQCPYVAKSVERIVAASRTLRLEPRVVRVGSAKAARELPTPYGVFCILYNGKLIAERPISATRFKSIMSKI